MVTRITSIQNPRVKAAVKLRDRRARDAQRRMLIDGVRELERAVSAGVTIQEVFSEEGGTTPHERDLLATMERNGAEPLAVSASVLQKLVYGDRTSGLVAVAEFPRRILADWSPNGDALIAVLEGVEKPGNLGAVVRSADAAGVAGVLIVDGGTDLWNPNVIRASAGTVFQFPVFEVTATEAASWLRSGGFRMLATRVDAATCYWDAPLTGRLAVVLGSESRGLSDFWRAPDITEISLPQAGVADSLNVSVTGAVLFYEAWRQRTVRELGRHPQGAPPAKNS